MIEYKKKARRGGVETGVGLSAGDQAGWQQGQMTGDFSAGQEEVSAEPQSGEQEQTWRWPTQEQTMHRPEQPTQLSAWPGALVMAQGSWGSGSQGSSCGSWSLATWGSGSLGRWGFGSPGTDNYETHAFLPEFLTPRYLESPKKRDFKWAQGLQGQNQTGGLQGNWGNRLW